MKQRLWKLRVRIHIWRKLMEAYYLDAKRYWRHSTEQDVINFTKKRLSGRITMQYHVLEKGLTMPEMKLKFGQQAVFELINNCEIFLKKFGNDNCQVNHAIYVLTEYVEEHAIQNILLNVQITERVKRLQEQISKFSYVANQVDTYIDQYFYEKIDFEKFARSRHSLRNFSTDDIPMDDIIKSIDLAQTAPTSCNRQPVRVNVVSDKSLIEKILKLHNGNRGFGHLSNKIIILSADISAYNEPRERNLVYIDSGIYAMNLLYALHFGKIGACALNWAANQDVDNELRKILRIPDSEVISLLIAIGKPPSKFKLAHSLRYSAEEITRTY